MAHILGHDPEPENNIIEEFQFGTGLLDDNRSQEEKEKDYDSKEVASAFQPINWREKPQNEWLNFPIMNQGQTSSCVAHAIAKCIGILNFRENGKYLDLSRRWIYSSRSNKPAPGMWFDQAMEYVRKNGVPLELLLQSEGLTEEQMNNSSDVRTYIIQIAEVFKTLGWVQLRPTGDKRYDIEELASIIETRGHILLGYRFDYDEWTAFPKVLRDNPPYHHAICGTDNTLYQGDKKNIIDDSWGSQTAINGKRLIDQEFTTQRCTFAGYFLNLAINTDPEQPKPKYNFTRNLSYGMENDPDVKALQDVLKYEEIMADNIPSTGNYYGMTASAVEKFQLKYGISPLSANNCGPMTREVLNREYGA